MGDSDDRPHPQPTARPDASGSDDRSASLLAWSLATFHATVVVVVPVTVLHAVGALGDLLTGLGTLAGLGLFVLLWTSTWVTNRRWLAECGLAAVAATDTRTDGEVSSPAVVLVAALKWGAVTGLAFFYGLLLLVVVPTLFSEPVAVGILLLAGTLVAPIVGALVGGLLALVDLGLFRLAGWLAPARPDPVPGRD